MEYRHIEVRPMASALGAEIAGVSLQSPSPEIVEEIRRALLEHQVVFFRGQGLDHESHVAFSRRFGSLYVHPALRHPDTHPEVQYIYYPEGHRPPAAEFHTDATFLPAPFLGCVLRAVTVPPVGGDTIWASLAAAYEALSPPLKALVDGLEAVHTPDRAFGPQGTIGGKQDARIAENNIQVLGEAVHPVVRTHPETGRRALFVNRSFTRRIVGLSEAESAAVLAFLFQHIECPDFQVRFRWSEGDVAFWDNRCTVHRVMNDFGGRKRLLFRTTIEGTKPQ